MSKRDWAREKIAPYVYDVRRFSGPMLYQDSVEAILQAERSRARRIVRAQIDSIRAEIRAIDDGHYDRDLNAASEVHQLQREIGTCIEILQRLQ